MCSQTNRFFSHLSHLGLQVLCCRFFCYYRFLWRHSRCSGLCAQMNQVFSIFISLALDKNTFWMFCFHPARILLPFRLSCSPTPTPVNLLNPYSKMKWHPKIQHIYRHKQECSETALLASSSSHCGQPQTVYPCNILSCPGQEIQQHTKGKRDRRELNAVHPDKITL